MTRPKQDFRPHFADFGVHTASPAHDSGLLTNHLKLLDAATGIYGTALRPKYRVERDCCLPRDMLGRFTRIERSDHQHHDKGGPPSAELRAHRALNDIAEIAVIGGEFGGWLLSAKLCRRRLTAYGASTARTHSAAYETGILWQKAAHLQLDNRGLARERGP